MADDDLLPPLEIPWQLASTTQVLSAGPPDQTTISLFTYVPDDAALIGKFPGQSLVFLKATVTLSPARLPAGSAPIAASALGEGIPCYHALLDLKVRPETGQLGGIRPYFHAAAPMRRQMIQAGIVGADVYEGESDGQVMGKSGSQVYETSSGRSSTSTDSAGFSLFGIGISGQSTATAVGATRSVVQVSDTTARQASQERRELVSHTTRVENVLTLLNTKYVGTPYLRFSLSPQPLQQLATDPSDPSLWFGQLLQRRSSGIEGIQEFTTVILVPKGEAFCVEARLRRVCLLDAPPGPADFDEPFSFQGTALGRLLDYLFTTFPIGTPLDELDVDVAGGLTPANAFQRPAIENWVVNVPGSILAGVISTGPTAGAIRRALVNYKTLLEVWLETLRDEYERELNRSPLERGTLVGEVRTLDTCFEFAAGGGLAVVAIHTGVSPLALVPIRPHDLDIGGPPPSTFAARGSTKARALETVTRWNTLDRRLGVLLANLPATDPKPPGGLNDRRVADVIVDRWARMRAEDPANLALDAAAGALGLGAKQRALLASCGVTDLKSLARALRAAPIVERYNEGRKATTKAAPTRKKAAVNDAPINFPLSSKDAAQIRAQIGERLFGPESAPTA